MLYSHSATWDAFAREAHSNALIYSLHRMHSACHFVDSLDLCSFDASASSKLAQRAFRKTGYKELILLVD